MKKLPLFEKARHGSIGFQNTAGRNSTVLFIGMIAIAVMMFLMLMIRLFQLTVVQGVYYRNLSDNNRIREIIIEPQRGKIVDRKGTLLVDNIPADINDEGVRLFSRRIYKNPEAFAHVLGYRQVADDADIKNDNCVNKITSGDKVGKKGIEKLYDCELRGTIGKKLIEINASGQYENTLNVLNPVEGSPLQLSIDGAMQQKAYETIKGKRAAVVALKPQTGEVLALTSSPSFSPQIFEDGKGDVAARLFNDKKRPLFNRATEGTYPPGSTFKMVITAAALEDKKVMPQTAFEDKGLLEAGSLKFHNWYFLQYGKVDGMVDAYKALQRSNDIYFYLVGDKIGPERMKFWAEEFGYHAKTGIGISEAEGIIPSTFWKEDVLKEKWYLGDTYNMSIGQGYITSTPLQVTVATMPFANDGYICQPQLLKSKSPFAKEPNCRKLKISQETHDVIKEGMRQACATGGTGWPFFDFKVKDPNVTDVPTPTGTDSAALKDSGTKRIEVGCKTGTAESYSSTSNPHAWFTVFAPYDNPEVVLTVIVEEGGQGSDVAGPIAQEVLKEYFERVE